MKIDAEIKSLSKILPENDSFYQIPNYQRPYSWDKENIFELVEDLVNSYLSREDKDDGNYFCGSLVLIKNSRDERMDIVDGQQRMTTFIIMACVFRDLFNEQLSERGKDFIKRSIQDPYEIEKKKLKFLTGEKYQSEFEKMLFNRIDFKETKVIEKKVNNKYLKNAHYLRDIIKQKIEEENLQIGSFLEWIYKNVVLTVITCPSMDSAIQIFNVLNDRGMPLSPIDILKSTLMQGLTEERRRTFQVLWNQINYNLEVFGLDIEGMLNSYLYYKLTSNPKLRIDKELLKIFKEENRDPIEILNEIKDFSNSYINIQTREDKYIYCLKYLRHKIYWTSILSTASFVEYSNFRELEKILVAYYYQNWVAGATVARIKQTSFNVLNLVKNKKSIEEIKSILIQNLKQYSTTKTFEEEINSFNIYERNWIKPLLLLIEYFELDDSKFEFISVDKTLQIEHILPQTPAGEWIEIFTEEEREHWTNSIANLTLLSMRKNIQAKNYPFKEKKKVYENKDNMKTSFSLTQDIFKNENWTIEELKARKIELINKISKKLKF